MLDNQRFCTECGTDMSDVINKNASNAQQHNTSQIDYGCTPNINNVPEYRVTPNNYTPQNIAPQTSEKGSGMAVTSLIMGIVSIIACFYGIIPSVLGVIFGCVSKSQGSKSAMATAGIVCSAIGATLFVLIWLFYFSYDSYYSYYSFY